MIRMGKHAVVRFGDGGKHRKVILVTLIRKIKYSLQRPVRQS